MTRTILSAALSVAAIACAQPSPSFDIASIRPSTAANARSSGLRTGHGRLDADNVTLKRCIMGAYGVGPNQVLGGPDWLDADRFQITAKADHPAGDQELMLMMRDLLADRFKLVLRREARPIQAYILEPGRNGPRLTKAGSENATTSNGRGNIVAAAITMDRFAEVLSRQMDLPVVNRTALDGAFDLTLQWTPQSTSARPPESPALDAVSVFTAIQEQLGLHLRAAKTPVDVLIVDHAERPGAN